MKNEWRLIRCNFIVYNPSLQEVLIVVEKVTFCQAFSVYIVAHCYLTSFFHFNIVVQCYLTSFFHFNHQQRETLLKTLRVRPFISFQNLQERVYDFAKSQGISYLPYSIQVSTKSTRFFCFKHFYWQVFKEGFNFFTPQELEGKKSNPSHTHTHPLTHSHSHTHTHTHPVCISEFINKILELLLFLIASSFDSCDIQMTLFLLPIRNSEKII